MNTKSILDCEKDSFDKLKKYQLPNFFKKIGIGVAVLSFVSLFVNKFTFDLIAYREMAKYGMLIGMLLISISKDNIEDERIAQLRMQSYSFAFISGVILALIQPVINYGIDLMLNVENVVFKGNGDFLILWILLSVQVLSFAMLKRFYR